VLGAGPAGLLAAHAAEREGRDVRIYTRPDLDGNPQKSELHGCQYLHAYIPDAGIPRAGRTVKYLLHGSAADYRRKVYGDHWTGDVSPDEFGPEAYHQAWDLRMLYDHLWAKWYDRMLALEVTPNMVQRSSAMAGKGQIVFSTVPAKALCLRPDEHKFVTQPIWAMGSRYGYDARMPYQAPDMTVECNGEDGPRWYRAATVFGHSTLEWPAGAKPPVSGVVPVQKPLSTDCSCHLSPRWHRLGRFGKWQKGYLVHHAYQEAEWLL
jgi:hypothetical protein